MHSPPRTARGRHHRRTREECADVASSDLWANGKEVAWFDLVRQLPPVCRQGSPCPSATEPALGLSRGNVSRHCADTGRGNRAPWKPTNPALTCSLTSVAVAVVFWFRTRTHLYKLLDRGEILSHRVGRDRRVRLSDLIEFEKQHQRDRRELAERFAHHRKTAAAANDEIADLL